jgi:hypothetical protein
MSLSKFSLPLAVSAALLTSGLTQAQTTLSNGTGTVISTSSTAGQVTLMGPDSLEIRTESSSAPLRYSSSATTSFVDQSGAPVAREVVASGLPVTVEYTREGERLIANRVVVHRQTTTTTSTTPAVIEKTTTITPPPVVVEKKVPVVVEKKVYVDRPVIVEKKVPVDRPVIVEKAVPAPVVEETTRTTTTTTTTPARK